MSTYQEQRKQPPITFFCDECSHEEECDTADFMKALEQIKNEGWKVRKLGNSWNHYCGETCRKAGMG